MGEIYVRKDSPFLWCWFYNARGERKQKSTGHTDEAGARQFLADLEREIDAARRAGAELGPLTVKRYSRAWLQERERRGVATWKKDEQLLRDYVWPLLGNVRLKEVTRDDIKDLIGALMKRGALSNKSIRHVYGTLRTLFSDALAERKTTGLTVTPCDLKERRGELPPNDYKDPTWHPQAVYTRSEIEQLISDPRIAPHRRVLWALVFLTGMRIDEAAIRRWRDYDATIEPLGRLMMVSAWRVRDRVEAEPKGGIPRYIPVHPTLAAILAQWKLSGFEAVAKRKPEPDDFIAPTRGRRWDYRNHFTANSGLRELHKDLGRLGLRIEAGKFRKRGQHDGRRTFISLCLANGASENLLKWVTHGRKKTVMGAYTVPPWETLCEQVCRLPVVLPVPAKVRALR